MPLQPKYDLPISNWSVFRLSLHFQSTLTSLEQARRFHPDRLPVEQKRQATLTFQGLAESYRILSDRKLVFSVFCTDSTCFADLHCLMHSVS